MPMPWRIENGMFYREGKISATASIKKGVDKQCLHPTKQP